MIYSEQKPTAQLTPYIDKYWYCKASNLTNKMLTIPLLHHEFVINFSESYQVEQQTDSIAWISGIQTRPAVSLSKGQHEMMGVLFKADGLKAFTNYSASDFTNYRIDASLVFGSSLAALLDELQNATDKIATLEHYLLRNLKVNHYPNYLGKTLKIFSEKVSIKEACAQISISNKSLINSYKKYIGINPIKYVQLTAVNKAICSLAQNPQQSLTKLAHGLNFFDQAHFIHSFQSITGMAPSQYCNAVLIGAVDRQSPNFVLLKG